MSVVAEFTVPAEGFVLGEALAAAPDVTVEFERVVTHSREWVMPFLWARGEDLPAFDAALDEDPTVVEATVTDKSDGTVIYKVIWSEDVQELVDAVFDREGTLLEAVGADGVWHLRLRFASQDQLADLESYFETAAPEFSLQRIATDEHPAADSDTVTPGQRELLLTALRAGYFEVPRRVTTGDLANELDISDSAVSQRLRRAVGDLVRDTVDTDVTDTDSHARTGDADP